MTGQNTEAAGRESPAKGDILVAVWSLVRGTSWGIVRNDCALMMFLRVRDGG